MSVAQIDCPLCDWHYEVPALDPRLGADTLASVFGSGIMLQHAIDSWARKIEELLDKHLKTHSLLEWVRKVSDLQHEIKLLKASFP